MTDSIELLETIGKDASLRRATQEDLAQVLTRLNASAGLKQAALTGDDHHLRQELGPERFETSNHPTTVSQTVPDEEDDDAEPGKAGGEQEQNLGA